MSTVRQSTVRRDVGLVGWQIRYEQRSYWRNRVAAFSRSRFRSCSWSSSPASTWAGT